jgi:TPR repeat protein
MNLVSAAEYHKPTADQHSADCQFRYGRCPSEGGGVPIDLVSGAKYYQVAGDENRSRTGRSLRCCLGRELFDATSYEVQSSVPLVIFDVFVKALGTGGKVPVTKEDARAISLLAKEFWLEDLLSECSALQISSIIEWRVTLSGFQGSDMKYLLNRGNLSHN